MPGIEGRQLCTQDEDPGQSLESWGARYPGGPGVALRGMLGVLL